MDRITASIQPNIVSGEVMRVRRQERCAPSVLTCARVCGRLCTLAESLRGSPLDRCSPCTCPVSQTEGDVIVSLYAVTVFMAAFLLFLVQPHMGKILLPRFGGAAAVWSVSMLFFQLLLLAGYAYAHLLTRVLSRRWQVRVHIGWMSVSLVLLGWHLLWWPTPIMPPAPESIRYADPSVSVISTLATSIGLPYFVLSATTPLLQSWYASRTPHRSPYILFAVSNAASLLALLGYPLLIEPGFSLRTQGRFWAALYALWSGMLVSLAAGVARVKGEKPRADFEGETSAQVGSVVRWWQPILWLGLSACGTTLLLGATNQLSQNVAAVPLLWVVPLALYLLSFVLAFSGRYGYVRSSLLAFLLVTQGVVVVLTRGNAIPLPLQLMFLMLIVFLGCWVCHGELARLRPGPHALTNFYLFQALGGALGSLFVNFVAPRVFQATLEFPIGILGAWILAGVAIVQDRQARRERPEWAGFALALLLIIGSLRGVAAIRLAREAFYHRTLAEARDFYGVLRVQEMTLGEPAQRAYRLVHGTTIHGVQAASGPLRRQPTSYFGPSSGVGLALEGVVPDGTPRRVGVLGLGVGTIAAYGRPGDVFRFYEIDPAVVRFALGEGGYFDYLSASQATVDVITGDARLALQRELDCGGSQAYDLLVLDVFSGDAPPVHMLTLEAFRLYVAHLQEDGALAVNVSTGNLDLPPVVSAIAREVGLVGVIIEDAGDGAVTYPSRWIVLVREEGLLTGGALAEFPDLQTAYDPRIDPWTDDYSNLVQVLR